MAPRSAWDGAIILGGFPIAVSAYSLLNSPSAESFKGLCVCHQQPVTMPKRCAVDDTVLGPDQILKGVQTGGRGKTATYTALPPDAVAALTNAERSTTLEIAKLPGADTVPWHLATGRYALVPNDKVPGSDGPVGILWNGLLASGRALVSEWSKRAGSRPVLMALRASDDGLMAVDLPFASSLKVDVPRHPFEVNEQAQGMFDAFVAQIGYDTADFVHDEFEDTYKAKRDELVAKALAGETIDVQPVQAAPAVPDLMAAMQAALAGAQAPAKKAPAKKKAKAAA